LHQAGSNVQKQLRRAHRAWEAELAAGKKKRCIAFMLGTSGCMVRLDTSEDEQEQKQVETAPEVSTGFFFVIFCEIPRVPALGTCLQHYASAASACAEQRLQLYTAVHRHSGCTHEGMSVRSWRT
jgi:hypothetical protein